jgi:RNA dependent RNA polymerase
MLWQDWASSVGAACPQCIALAEQHAIAVDFGKTGLPASIPDVARWKKKSKAHWREKKAEPAYHCMSVIGKLYDEVTYSVRVKQLENFTIALAGRKIDRYGLALSIGVDENWAKTKIEKVYKANVPLQLGWLDTGTSMNRYRELQDYLTAVATELRFTYEEHVMKVMHQYELRNEGELYTGCIRKLNSIRKSRPHEIAEEVRRHAREIYFESRSSFFRSVLEIVRASRVVFESGLVLPPPGFASQGDAHSISQGENRRALPYIRTDFVQLQNRGLLAEPEPDELVGVEEMATSDNVNLFEAEPRAWMVRTVARKLAAAGYMVTYSPFRETQVDLALFGFPWIVADVMACGIAEHEQSRAPV